MGLFLEDLDDHEGYADRRLADGRLARGIWSHGTKAFSGYVAACGCGWHASLDWPPTEDGEEFAEDQWYREHAEPLLERQANRRRDELARMLAWLSSQADRLEDPATLQRIGRATDRARRVVADVRRNLERQAPKRGRP